jgi:hypothetical protein
MKSEFTMTEEKTPSFKWIDFEDRLNNIAVAPKGNVTFMSVGKRLKQWL